MGTGTTGNRVIWPDVLIRPIRPSCSANHRFPSGPATMPAGEEGGQAKGSSSKNSVITPDSVILPTMPCPVSVNQRFPSWPAVIPVHQLLAVGVMKIVTMPVGVIRPM